MKLKLSIVGCGRLGKVLAALFVKTGLVCIQDIVNLNISSSKRAVAFIGQGRVCRTLKQIESADFYLISTPDDQIEFIAEQLARQGKLKRGDIVFHCSGLLSSSSLNSVTRFGCYTASLHPLFSFSEPLRDVKNFRGTYCAFEGNKKAFDGLSPLLKAIEAQLFLIEKKDKPLYHAASVLASNYLITLSAMARECYSKSGLNEELSENITHALMFQALTKVCRLSPREALTGPIERADRNTLKKHLIALKAFPELRAIYKSLGKATLTLTGHNNALKKTLTQLL